MRGFCRCRGYSLDANLINQEPYPAVPGEYVKVVFQITGVDNPECGKVDFEIAQSFPFSLDLGTEPKVSVRSGIYTRNYAGYFMVP